VVVIVRDDASHDAVGARVLVDGVARTEAAAGRAIELDPGQHTVRIEGEGKQPVDHTITVFQGERDRLVRFTVQPSSSASGTGETPGAGPSSAQPHSRPYVPALVAGGASLAILGISAWLGLSGRSDLSNLRGTCAPACTDAQVDPVRGKLLASDVLLGTGIVGAAVSTFLFVRALQSSSPAPPSTGLDIAPTNTGATVSMHTTF
jgi:hypothetical protein